MKARRTLLAASIAAGALTLGAVPAQAIGGPGPGGGVLWVTSYHTSGDPSSPIVGQSWFGCGSGRWGQTTAFTTLSTANC